MPGRGREASVQLVNAGEKLDHGTGRSLLQVRRREIGVFISEPLPDVRPSDGKPRVSDALVLQERHRNVGPTLSRAPSLPHPRRLPDRRNSSPKCRWSSRDFTRSIVLEEVPLMSVAAWFRLWVSASAAAARSSVYSSDVVY